MYAVVTRELATDSPYVAVLAAHGLTAVALPVTRTERVEHTIGDRYDFVVVASARAAADYRVTGAEVWAVGLATQVALAQHGVSAVCPPDVVDGATLVAAMIAERAVAGKAVLVPRAEDGRTEMIEALRAAGARVDDVIAYRTVPTPHDDPSIARGAALVRAGDAAVTVVFAPSQVAALAALLGDLARVQTRFAAIGDTTGAALRAAGVSHPLVAATPTPEGIASALSPVYPRTS